MTRRRAVVVLPVVGVLCAGLAAGPSAASAADTGAGAAGSGAAGTVQLVAGGGALAADGVPATDAALQDPRTIGHDVAGDVFIAEAATSKVRRVDARTGLISTVTGVRGPGLAPEYGPQHPLALAVSPAGDVFVAGDDAVEEFTHDGRLLTLIGPGSALPETRVLATGAALSPAGDLYLTDYSKYVVRVVKLSPQGVLTTVAGGVADGQEGDGGPAVVASVHNPEALTWAPDGALVFLDNGLVRRIGPDGVIGTLAGGGSAACDGAPAAAADLTPASGLAFDRAGRLLISEFGAKRVQRIEADGTLRTVFGQGYSWTGPKRACQRSCVRA